MSSSDAPAPPRRPRLRGWLTGVRPGVLEPVFAGLLALPLLASAPLRGDDRLGFTVELLLCAANGAVGRWPVQASLASGALMLGLLAFPADVARYSIVTMMIPIVSLGARGMQGLRFGMAAWFVGVAGVGESLPGPGESPPPAPQVINGTFGWLFLAVLALVAGTVIRAAGRDRERLVRDRAAAVQAQRRSIARDLHDTVAYATTSIIMRAEQAKLRGVPDPELAADLDYIIHAGRSSMRDLRGMMETLRRNEPDAVEPEAPWRVDSPAEVLDARVAHLREHGFEVTAHVDADLASLPESVRDTLGKVIVEATANIVKHGDPTTPVSVLIEADEGDVEAVFINQARSRAGRVDGQQLGLIGARERVEALGGELEVARESPAWVVRARIPLEG